MSVEHCNHLCSYLCKSNWFNHLSLYPSAALSIICGLRAAFIIVLFRNSKLIHTKCERRLSHQVVCHYCFELITAATRHRLSWRNNLQGFQIPLRLYIFLHFDCKFYFALNPKLSMVLWVQRFLFALFLHINFNLYNTGDGIKQLSGSLSL